MPSLKPNRLRGVACAGRRRRRAPEARAGTSARARRPKAIRARLRMACTATCGSSAQAWTQRSPSLTLPASRASPREVRQPVAARPAAGRRARSGPCRPGSEQRRAEAEGEREPGRRQAERLAGVVGRGVVRAADGARTRRRSSPAVIRAAASVQSFSSAIRSSRDVGGAGRTRRSAGGPGPGWRCRPGGRRRTAYGVAGRRRRAVAGTASRRAGRRRARRRRRRPPPAAGQRRASRRRDDARPAGAVGGVGPAAVGSIWRSSVRATTAAVSFDSGSPRALTASESSLTCGLGEVGVEHEAVALACTGRAGSAAR